MSLEIGTWIKDLVSTNPVSATDAVQYGANHLQLIKKVLQNSITGFAGLALCAGQDTGAVNTMQIAPTPALAAYTGRGLLIWRQNISNTGAATIQAAGLPAIPVNSVAGAALALGDLVAGHVYVAAINEAGTACELVAVTKNYCDQLAFNTALPAQAGNAGLFLTTNGSTASWGSQYPSQTGHSGQFLTTNGTVPSWAYPGIGTVNATVTASATLTGPFLYVPVAMTALGQSITLPAATTLSVGGPQYIIDNTKGLYPVGIRDNTGVLLMAVEAGGEAYVGLKDNTTAAGIWSVQGTSLSPGLITIDSMLSSTYSGSFLAPYAAFDNNTSVHFVALAAGGFGAVVVDNTGKVLTTPVTVTSTASAIPYQCFKIDATHAIVFYGTGAAATTTSAAVLSLSGSSPTLSLAVGTAASISTTWAQQENFVNAPNIVQLASGSYLLAGSTSSLTSTVACSVSGTTVTFGSMTNIVASGTANNCIAYPLTATTALVIYVTGAAAPWTVNAAVVTVSGTTCTPGTPAAGGSLSASQVPMAAQLSATKAIVASDNNSGTVQQAQAITVTGTTVAWGAALTVESSASTIGGPQNSYTYCGAASGICDRYRQHIYATGSNSAVFLWGESTGQSRVCTFSESGGTLTKGATLYQSVMPQTANGYGMAVPQSAATEFLSLQLQVDSTQTQNRPFVTPHQINGTAITTGNGFTLGDSESLNSTNTLANCVATRLGSSDYVFGLTAGAANNRLRMLQVLRANGYAVNNRGSVRIPDLQPLAMPIQTPASNRIVIVGRTLESTAGNTTSQARILNIEVAA